MNNLRTGTAPIVNKLIQVKDAYDANLQAANLTNWYQEYDQTSAGQFCGRIVELPFNGLQVFKESSNRALQQRCLVWPSSIWLGIPLAQQQACKINGIPIDHNNVMCRPGNHGFELSTPAGYDLFGMVVDQVTLCEFADRQEVKLNWQEIKTQGRLRLPEQTLFNLRFVLSRLLNENNRQAASYCNKLSYDLLIMALLEMLATETPQPVSQPSYTRKKKVVDTAKNYIQQHSELPISINELCNITNVSQRTLQYSFESILGISPHYYLRVARLNGVRRDLLYCEARKNILDVASSWGFWHMSQFAKDYKRLFGESPSQTKSRFVEFKA